jgi:uncharacterized protein with von Willebrand factor type A (vWA) domain
MPDSPALLRGTDRASFAAALVARLREAGVPVGLTGAQDLVHALQVSPPLSMGDLYWTARIALVHRAEEIAAFDAMFGGLFTADGVLVSTPAQRGVGGDRSVPVPSANRGNADRADLPWSLLPAAVAEHETAVQTGYAVALRLPSAMPATADRPFEKLDPAELALLGAWLRDAVRHWPNRRSRRLAPHHHGPRIAWRPTMARSRRTGGEPLHLVRVKPVRKPRRVVMLCDVSQSMQAQAAAYLHLMRAVALVTDAEVFAFATALTRLTAVLAHREPAVAVAAATAAVDDRFGGTRIAGNLRALLCGDHRIGRLGQRPTGRTGGGDGPAATPRVPGDLDEPAGRHARLRAAGGGDGGGAPLLRRAAAGRHLPIPGGRPGERQLHSVTWMDGLKWPTLTPRPRTIAWMPRGVAANRASSAAACGVARPASIAACQTESRWLWAPFSRTRFPRARSCATAYESTGATPLLRLVSAIAAA